MLSRAAGCTTTGEFLADPSGRRQTICQGIVKWRLPPSIYWRTIARVSPMESARLLPAVEAAADPCVHLACDRFLATGFSFRPRRESLWFRDAFFAGTRAAFLP